VWEIALLCLQEANKKAHPPAISGFGTPRVELYAELGKSQGSGDAYAGYEKICIGLDVAIFARNYATHKLDTYNTYG